MGYWAGFTQQYNNDEERRLRRSIFTQEQDLRERQHSEETRQFDDLLEYRYSALEAEKEASAKSIADKAAAKRVKDYLSFDEDRRGAESQLNTARTHVDYLRKRGLPNEAIGALAESPESLEKFAKRVSGEDYADMTPEELNQHIVFENLDSFKDGDIDTILMNAIGVTPDVLEYNAVEGFEAGDMPPVIREAVNTEAVVPTFRPINEIGGEAWKARQEQETVAISSRYMASAEVQQRKVKDGENVLQDIVGLAPQNVVHEFSKFNQALSKPVDGALILNVQDFFSTPKVRNVADTYVVDGTEKNKAAWEAVVKNSPKGVFDQVLVNQAQQGREYYGSLQRYYERAVPTSIKSAPRYYYYNASDLEAWIAAGGAPPVNGVAVFKYED